MTVEKSTADSDTDELKRKAAAGDPAAIRTLITPVDQLEGQEARAREQLVRPHRQTDDDARSN